MIDGWGWSIWRGQVVAAGTFRAVPIAETPVAEFDAEMARWGVTHLFVWTDATRAYLADSGRFVERWRGGRWSEFVRLAPDDRSVVVPVGSGALRNLDWLGADVELRDVRAGDAVVVRTNYYPAWTAFLGDRAVALHDSAGQLALARCRRGQVTSAATSSTAPAADAADP
jgi:hypothetical protein